MNEIIWEIRVPIFKNRLILKQLGFAVGIPFGILLVFLLIIKAYNGLILVGLMLILAFLLIMLVFRGTYDVRYVINEKGILCQNQNKQEKRVKKLSSLTFLLGIFKGNPTVAGIGLSAYSSTGRMLAWKRIKKIKYHDEGYYILVHSGFTESIALFCKQDNYDEVKHCLSAHDNIH